MDTVYTEVTRGLHYMHALSFFESHLNGIGARDPQRLDIYLVLSFDEFLDTTIHTSIGEVIKFVRLVL